LFSDPFVSTALKLAGLIGIAALMSRVVVKPVNVDGFNQVRTPTDEQADSSEHHHESDDFSVVEMERTDEGIWIPTGIVGNSVRSAPHCKGKNLVLDDKTRTDQDSTEQ
jgi:hypothetical protein